MCESENVGIEGPERVVWLEKAILAALPTVAEPGDVEWWPDSQLVARLVTHADLLKISQDAGVRVEVFDGLLRDLRKAANVLAALRTRERARS